VAAWLAIGKDEAVVSHESALDLWDLSDVVPDAVHVTVPRACRSLARRPPPGVIVHTTTRPWEKGEVRKNGGIRVTSPARTILDAAAAGTQAEQIEMAIRQALRRGWLDALHPQTSARTRELRIVSIVERALVGSQIEARCRALSDSYEGPSCAGGPPVSATSRLMNSGSNGILPRDA
jgi:predicted transcriptional regulator of viral defense system